MFKAPVVDHVRGLLSAVRYRPGWTFTARPTPFGDRCWILIDGEVLDSDRYHSGAPSMPGVSISTRVGVRAVVPPFTTATQFYAWLSWRLQRIERHESREFLWINGSCWDSPHKRPQPPVDYQVRKTGSFWSVYRYGTDGERVSFHRTWNRAYEAAWLAVIDADLGKGEAIING